MVGDERQLRGRQGRLAFAYLVSESIRPVSREELARAVWGDELAPSWESALNALMSRIRRLLSTEALRVGGVSLAHGLGKYQLLLPADVWIDLEAATSAVDAAENILRSGDYRRVLGPATVAVAITRRPFLAGVEGEWVESQRRKLERQLVRALDCISKMWILAEDPALAIENCIEAVRIDPYRESSYRLLMQAYVASGNPSEAVRAYHRLRELLAEELGTRPSGDTEALYLGILD